MKVFSDFWVIIFYLQNSQMQENELIIRLQQGDNNAFKQLVDDFRDKVVATCYGYTGDYEAALDLAQDVFVEVYRSVGKFRGDAKISTWIYRISINKSLNWVRDNKKHKTLKSIQRFFLQEKDKQKDIEDMTSGDAQSLLQSKEDSQIIQKAIDKLPENQKIAFVLNKIDGLSYKQVCEVMDISLASVESLIHRARKKLQKELISVYGNK